MRSMIFTVIASLAVVIGIGLFCGFYSLRTGENFQIRAEEISVLVRQQRWDEALSQSLQMEKDWEKISRLLSMWVSHESVDDVGIGLSRLSISLRMQEEYHSLLYIAEISTSLSMIYQKDAFSLKNIL